MAGDLVPASGTSLDNAERARLAQLEVIVERGLHVWLEVGQALLEILDSRLYREAHPNFESYLRQRWNVSRAHGYRLIDAVKTAEEIREVSPSGDIPKTEAQAREMKRIKSENIRAAVVERIEADGGWGAHTAKDVRRIIAEETDRWQRRQRSYHSSAACFEVARLIVELEQDDWSLEDLDLDVDLLKRIRRVYDDRDLYVDQEAKVARGLDLIIDALTAARKSLDD